MHNKKIRLLNVLTSVDDGGLEMLVYRIYRGLGKYKYKLMLVSLTPRKNNFLEKDFEEIGTAIIFFDFRNKGKGFLDTIHNIIQFFLFIKFLWVTGFDVIHSHDFFPAFIARTGLLFSLKKIFRPGIKIFTTYHNVYYWLKPIHHKINRFLSFFTEIIVCVSNTVKEVYTVKESIVSGKLEVIRNGVNDSQFFPDFELRLETREKLGYSDSNIVIGCVAVLTERKGQIYLLEAFNELLKNHSDTRLLFVGGSREHETDYADMLREFVMRNSLESCVMFQPPVKSVNPLYNAIDICVLPSVTEGFGLSAFECMLTEKICLFSDIDVFKELTLNGKYGYHFERKNSTDLLEKLDYIISNFKEISSNAKNFRRFVADNYSEKVMVRKYDEMYKKALKKE